MRPFFLLPLMFIIPACGLLGPQPPVVVAPVASPAVEAGGNLEDNEILGSENSPKIIGLGVVDSSTLGLGTADGDTLVTAAVIYDGQSDQIVEPGFQDGQSDALSDDYLYSEDGDALSDGLQFADGNSDDLDSKEESSTPIADRAIPCIHSFEELLATLPNTAMGQLTTLKLEKLALDHPHVRTQFVSWYGGCRAQAKLHRALDRGEQIYFPIIDEEARVHFPEAMMAGPDETPLIDVLKALTVVESLVNTNAISWAGAGGPWQFMRSTFSRITKRIGDEDPYPAEDLRFDWAAASRAAFELTRENLKAFQWTKSPLACAIMAYNGGISRVSQSLKKQAKLDCRQLKHTKYSTKAYIATETYMYQPRIMMVLMVISWRRANGYSLLPLSNYQPIELRGEGAIRLQTLAEKAQVDYKDLLKNNRRYPLGVTPTGPWHLAVTSEMLPALEAALPEVERISDERIMAMLQKAAPLDIVLLLGDDAFRYYKVRPGDNVGKICQRFHVTRSRLYQLNKGLFAKNKKRSKGRDWMLYPGQRLRLPGLDQLIFQ